MARGTLMRVAVLVSLTLLIVAIAGVASGAPQNPVVSGTVFASDGAVIPGATVVINELRGGVYRQIATRTTDSSGLWTYTDKANTYRFDFSAPNADPTTVNLVMAKGGVYTANVTLQSYGTIAGVISALPGGEPLGGATVAIFRRNADSTWPTTPHATVVAAGDGSYSRAGLPTGVYAVKATATGYVAAFLGGVTIDSATPLTVTRGATIPASFGLAPAPSGATISGVVVSGAARTPLNDAFVYLYRQNADGTWPPTSPGWGSPTYTFYSASDGSYTTGPIALGTYRVRFFTVHLSSQWWQYVPTVDLATPVALTFDGQTITGIDGWYGKP